eukprot:TRINITY_DN6789_c0_g1_i4.p1 TRINITY_DN6789_c0_g1~~TRINITY_DN6789_c0_g1_i4.p1  ORF type:complete len:381 (+),score=61.05 TRINITY_DN6789_c0_g1_i4:79-1143(+)
MALVRSFNLSRLSSIKISSLSRICFHKPNERLTYVYTNPTQQQRRHFFNVPSFLDTITRGINGTATCSPHTFTESLLVPFSLDAIYEVISSVDRYQEFLPWCLSSQILSSTQEKPEVPSNTTKGEVRDSEVVVLDGTKEKVSNYENVKLLEKSMSCLLTIGFDLYKESYISHVKLHRFGSSGINAEYGEIRRWVIIARVGKVGTMALVRSFNLSRLSSIKISSLSRICFHKPNERLTYVYTNPTQQQRRHFFNVPSFLDTITRGINGTATCSPHTFTESLLVPFSLDAIYEVISSVDRYQEFLPWCLSSQILSSTQEKPEVPSNTTKGEVRDSEVVVLDGTKEKVSNYGEVSTG